MDYAIQLLTILAIFLFGGLWLKDNVGLPMWGVVVLFFVGVISGLVVIYKRSVEEAAKEAKRNKPLKPLPPEGDADKPESLFFPGTDDNADEADDVSKP